ncbi:MAG: helix-turn-helix transcriptional regulator [Candidatus Pacebacteria bacterium]|nr:helix-turn-helix transcriptional regulator [Candidatus Paceibacterota bacterium]
MRNRDPVVDTLVGKRIRRRRRLLGLTQQQLGGSVGVRFQQIQKYECGANQVSASRLWQLSEALEVPIGYFFEGLNQAQDAVSALPTDSEVLSSKETIELVRAYYALGERPRRRLLDLAKSLHAED